MRPAPSPARYAGGHAYVQANGVPVSGSAAFSTASPKEKYTPLGWRVIICALA